MKHFKQDFSLNAWVQSPGWDLGDEAKAKIKLIRNMVMLHYQIKALDACSNMVANIVPTDTPLPQGWGQNIKIFFLKVVMLHIKLKGIEHHESKYSVLTHTLGLCGWVKRSNMVFLF